MPHGNILIAEDSPDIREVLQAYLSAKGHSITLVDDGLKAVDALDGNRFDLIISDINMPGLDGLEFLGRAKEISPDTPFILITGFPTMENAIQAIRKGASDYITKPFKFKQIDLILEKFIHRPVLQVVKQPPEQSEQPSKTDAVDTKLDRKVHELSKLYHISESISHITDEETLFRRVVEVAAEVTQAQNSYLLFKDSESSEFFVKEIKAADVESIRPEETYVEGRALDALLQTRQLVEGGRDLKLVVFLGSATHLLSRFLLVPLIVKRELFGGILVSRDAGGEKFTRDDELVLVDLSHKVTLTLENSILYHTLYMHVVSTLQSLVASVEAKDPYTQRHSYRVTQMAKKIAGSMGCSDQELESLEFAGLLHDLGKIGVSDVVLAKKAPLTDEEWLQIRKHPEIGESIVRPLKLFSEEAAIIRHHHERWDGKGYPDGLKGQEIPFLARIITVADAFDAMVSNRPYRPGKEIGEALEEINRFRGTQFDPAVVDAFLRLAHDQLEQERWETMNVSDSSLTVLVP